MLGPHQAELIVRLLDLLAQKAVAAELVAEIRDPAVVDAVAFVLLGRRANGGQDIEEHVRPLLAARAAVAGGERRRDMRCLAVTGVS